MKLLFLDSTAVCSAGPGSPAFFSRYAIEHFRALGHEVEILGSFQPDACRAADVVITEWANQEAYEAAASGLCRKLIVHMRGFDAHGPLDQMEWANVDVLVYESPFLKSYVKKRFPGLRGFRSHVIPSGVDVANIPFKERKSGPVVAMVGRADAAKGYQLAFEWMRQRDDLQLHVGIALGENNPRLVQYLEHVKPPNVTLHGPVDTVKWLDEIDANYLLSASSWETLGYTIAEAMALGIKPLIHDTLGAEENWPNIGRWDSLSLLDMLVGRPPSYGSAQYSSEVYRHFVEEHLDAYRQSRKFADLVLAPPTRALAPPPSAVGLILQVEAALQSNQLASADTFLLDFRDRTPRLARFDDHRAGLALKLAAAYVDSGDLDRGRVWALRSLGDIVRVDTLCLLGEIAAAEGDLENAERWYDASLDVSDQATRYPSGGLVADKGARCVEIARELRPVLACEAPEPHRFLIVVAVRNAEKYIGACLESIKAQPQMASRRARCVVIDDASTDETLGRTIGDLSARKEALGNNFFLVKNGERKHSLRNIVEAIHTYGEPTDIVVIVDGDDQLDSYALSVIEDAYNRGAWMTYGNFKTSSGRASWMPPYPHRIVKANAFRAYPWSVSHPKTFRKALFDKIKIEDFQHEGEWFKTAGDVALMMPMLEMAAERAMYLSAPIYLYNEDNPQADHRVDPQGQVDARNIILAKPKYERLEKL